MQEVALWSDKYRLNIAVVDEQHQYLFELIHSLISAAPSELPQGVKRLMEYTQEHFCEEERLMRAIEFPEYERHKKLHRELIETLEKMTHLMFDHPEKRDAFEKFILKWLTNHILQEDMKFKNL